VGGTVQIFNTLNYREHGEHRDDTEKTCL